MPVLINERVKLTREWAGKQTNDENYRVDATDTWIEGDVRAMR
jgi:hypothetical protein